ncbi:MAG: L-2-amino-thiazoline-4-carboxylic acid hydrolase [Anaerolineae bacterium]|nr:L-2-amino-thiazoline-4-carboxylic acid hydrolase [Anaerolineae bacterium]
MSDNQTLEEQLVSLRKELDRSHTGRLLWLLNGLKDRLGEQVVEAVNDIVEHDVREEWKQIAERENSHTIEDFLRLLWELLSEQGFEYTSEKTDEGCQMCVTACPIATLAKELNAQDWLYAYNCACDPLMVEGFNPKIGFRRTKTLLEGDDCCDHFYFYREE